MFDALRIRPSNYSVTSEEAEVSVPATIAMAYQKPENQTMVAPIRGHEAAEEVYSSVEMHPRPTISTVLGDVPFERHHATPRQTVSCTGDTSSLNECSTPPEASYQDVHLCLDSIPPSPDSSRSGAPVTPLPQSSALRTCSPKATGPHRRITDPLEQMIFQFYIEHAGPWVCYRKSRSIDAP